MSVFVLDSNILSFYLRQNQQIIKKIHNTLLEGHEVLISPIAYYEIKRGLLAIKSEKRLREFDSLCKVLGVQCFHLIHLFFQPFKLAKGI